MSHQEFKTRLEKELEELTSDLESIAKLTPETNDWVAVPPVEEMMNADNNVEADSAEEWAERRAVVSELEARYRNIVRALDKFKEGTYGICEISQEPIEEERLNVNPAARTNLANIDREKELPI